MPSPLKELRRQLKVLPPSVAELRLLYEQWELNRNLDSRAIPGSPNHLKQSCQVE